MYAENVQRFAMLRILLILIIFQNVAFSYPSYLEGITKGNCLAPKPYEMGKDFREYCNTRYKLKLKPLPEPMGISETFGNPNFRMDTIGGYNGNKFRF